MIKIVRIKKYIIPFILLFFTICLVIFSSTNLSAAKSGLVLWATSVVPSLFPFFVATELLSQTNIPYILGKFFTIFMKPLFNVRGEGSFALIMGIISGYPVGAKIACNFRQKNILSKQECERLLSFTNNSGPLFILGTVGINMYGSTSVGILLLITHILACLTVGFLFRFWKKSLKDEISNKKFRPINFTQNEISIANLGECLSESISNATSTLMMIGGFVVMFSVIVSILNSSHIINVVSSFFTPLFSLLHIPASFNLAIISGIFEITNGISLVSNIHIKAISINIIITSFLLGIGGLSVFLQVLSITSKSDLSIKPYILGKMLHGFIAAFYTYLFINFIPVFNINL